MIPYVFNTKEVIGQSLIHLINIYFEEDITGVEIGTGHAQSLCTWLQQCNKIKTIHSVDPYKPYQNFLKNPYNEEPFFIGDDKIADSTELTATHNIKFSGFKDKVVIHKEDSLSVSKKFKDNSLDFIFLDGYSNANEVETDLNVWYPKLKNGGLFSGHDWDVEILQERMHDFRKNNNITNSISSFDNVWVWKK
jgi:hypothetical protein